MNGPFDAIELRRDDTRVIQKYILVSNRGARNAGHFSFVVVRQKAQSFFLKRCILAYSSMYTHVNKNPSA